MTTVRDQLQQTLGSAYSIERELTGGGMSSVFLATETALARRVVIKVLPPELTGGVSVERFRREIAIAASLQHPNIVPLLAAGESGGLPWYAMPFVAGDTLRQRLATGELPVAEAMRAMRDVASALASAHAAGVAHRDIKPENVLLVSGAAMVMDFGIARALSEALGGALTSTGLAIGTPAYMSPEQAGSEDTLDHRTDIYSLGLLAYEMLTGRNPFDRRTAQATLAAHMREVAPSILLARPAVPATLDRLIARCLAKSPADRPQSARELIDALDALATPTDLSAARPVESASRPRTRAIAAVAVLAATVAIWAGLKDRGGGPGSGAPPIAEAPQAPIVDPTRITDAMPGALTIQRVAVLPLENLSGEDDLSVVSEIAAVEIASGILQAGHRIVDLAAVRVAVPGAVSASGLAALVRDHGSTMMVKGSFTKSADSLRFQASVTEAATGNVLYQLDPETAPRGAPLPAIERLRDRLLSAVAGAEVARQVRVTLRPPKYEAFQAYRLAMASVASRGICNGESRPHIARALQLDSLYMDAFTLRIECEGFHSDSSAAVADRFERRRGSLTSYDQLQLDYVRARLRGDNIQELASARRAFELTGSPRWALRAGILATNLWRPRLALQFLNRVDTSSFEFGLAGKVEALVSAHHQARDYEAELRAIEDAERLLPESNRLPFRKAAALIGLGRSREVLPLIDSVLAAASNPESFTRSRQPLRQTMLEMHAHQDLVGLGGVMNRVIARLRTLEPVYTQQARGADWESQMFEFFMLGGQSDSARAHFATAPLARIPFRSTDRGAAFGWLAELGQRTIRRAYAGDSVWARAIADSIMTVDGKWARGQREYWRAGIIAQLGRRDEAVDLLKKSIAAGNRNVGWHVAFALMALRGYPPFEAVMNPENR